MPPMPPGMVVPIRSPKDAEHVASLAKVPSTTVQVVSSPSDVVGPKITIKQQVSGVQLSWSGLTPPFLVEQSSLDGKWQSAGNYTMLQSKTVPVTGQSNFFRVSGSRVSPLSAQLLNNQTHLSWTVPDFS